MVAEEKKDPVIKRLEEGFEYILEKHYQAKGFKIAWENAIKVILNLYLASCIFIQRYSLLWSSPCKDSGFSQ